jgi:hypothetical protein
MTVIDGPNGARYYTASAVQHVDGYSDVTPHLLGSWRRTGAIAYVTVAQLAAALGRDVPTDVTPTAPAKYPGPSGPEYLYEWTDVVQAEAATARTRRTRGGRPRATPPAERPA